MSFNLTKTTCLNICPTVILYWTKGGRMFNNEELEDLKFMIEKGFTQSQAAQVLGKSVLEVKACVKAHGIRSPFRDKEKDGLFFCKKCSTYKTKQEFDNYKKSKHGVSTHCKVCRSENYKLLRQKKCFAEIDALIEKSKENEKTKEEVFGKKRRSCSVCGITKDIDEFNWSIKYKSLRPQCRKCQSEYKKKWELKRIEERGY